MSVWVEIKYIVFDEFMTRCHAPRERVSWNYIQYFHFEFWMGHAPRERVSWNCRRDRHIWRGDSHAPRERVSWNLLWLQVRLFVTCHAPHERVGQFSFQRRTYRYWIIQVTAWLRSGGIFIPKYYTFFMCFPSNPPIHTPKFVQINDL